LVLVIYSDVREWYSQKRATLDRPMGSLGFLATGVFRAFRELNTQTSTKVRKQIRATAQLYWEGKFYSGRATEMGVMSLRVELDPSTAYSDTTEQTSPLLTPEDLRRMEQDEPFVGLLLSQESTNQLPQRLLAQIVDVEDLSDQVAIELKFPDQLKQKQETKIKQLLKVF
ncbi:MAG: cellulose synthase, partial [Moorea sp. SIO4A3]|nr:cellulose synthase [Moorena sp. SIO4A3]